ncbi:PxKF domain-containing protein [Kineococcus glutinatus]|uniref:Fibronectin type-III domain-containing protein n=1 Tax=Kineococcus glutinatus TaxID=1070872 RepID=A0ABP9HPV6_9ACTN
MAPPRTPRSLLAVPVIALAATCIGPVLPAAAVEVAPGAALRLDFGPGATAAGHTKVEATTAYSAGAFGFTDPAKVTGTDRGGPDALRSDFVTARDTTFSVDLPNADYTVSLVAGDATGATEIAITAESIQKVQTTAKAAGEYLEMNFDIALVDGRLDLDLSGATPNLNALVITRKAARTAGEKPTAWLAGDSTVQTYDPYWMPEAGWGQMIPRFFSDRVVFENKSIGGRSSKSFLVEGRLDEVLRNIRPGDYFFVQFGHNDATVSRPERYASPADYKKYLQVYVEGARQRGATPVLVTPVGRRDFDPATGKFNVSFPEYVQAMKEVATELDVVLLDLSAASRAYYDEVGPEGTKAVFLHAQPGIYQAWINGVEDDTHFQEYGAIQIARLVATLTKGSPLPLAQQVREVEPPAAVPAQVGGLAVGSVSNAAATARWNPAAGADVYRVYRKKAAEPDSAWTLVGATTVPSQPIGGLAEGTAYSVRVVAVNGRGESAPSEAVTFTTRSANLRFDFGPAGAPVAAGYTQVTRADVYTPEKKYGLVGNTAAMIDRDRGAAADDLRRDFVAYFNNSYEFAVDVPNGTYAVKSYHGDLLGTVRSNVRIEGKDHGAANASRGTAEKVVNEVAVTDGQLNVAVSGATAHLNGLEITPLLLAPAALTLDSTSLEQDPATAVLSWTATEGAVKYRVYRGEPGAAKPALLGEVTGTTFTDATADLGIEHSYRVASVDAGGLESVPSAPLVVPMLDPAVATAPVPTGLSATDVRKKSVTLTWTGDAAARSYRVFRATKADGPYTLVGRSSEPRFTDTTVLTTIPYFYRVAAVNAGGVSERSAPVETPAVTVLQRPVEHLDRAPVAVKTDQGVYVGWRLLGLDPADLGFHVYRDGTRITQTPVTGATNLLDPAGTAASRYRVVPVSGGVERPGTAEVGVWGQQYLPVALDKPADGYTKDGQPYTYSAGDSSVGDLDGDGTYEVVVKWDPSNAKDNSQAGYTGEVLLDAYRLDGTRLWRIALGPNIRAGAHYTQFLVQDLDLDGKAEVALKTADGTVDGTGGVIGRAGVDHRNSTGYVLLGDEFLTVFDGRTGAARDTVAYDPPRGDVAAWGDAYGNRVDRFLAGVAYLDGERPSMVFSRGYYTRTVLAAYDFTDGKIVKRWRFDTDDDGLAQYAGQGNHNLAVADVDRDGKDEITFGAMAVDDDGTPLYTTGLGHGDALHVADHDPARPGLETFAVQEHADAPFGLSLRDAETGEILWGEHTGIDTGRGIAVDIDPRHPGSEAWASNIVNAQQQQVSALFNAEGEKIADAVPSSTNFGVWWDGDLLRELQDSNRIDKWNWQDSTTANLLTATGASSNNGTKANPALQADLFGDWREEVVWRSADSQELRIYTTTDVTEHRIRTLMHDPVYRLGVTWQNVGYNQPPHTSFHLGVGMQQPKAPSILYTAAPAHEFGNFTGPVSTGGRNTVNAGRTVPLKWRVVHHDGTPVTDLRKATVTARTAACGAGTTRDLPREETAGGLQNLGDGWYQVNWRTPKSYAGSCKTVSVDVGGGTVGSTVVTFTK